MFYCFFIKFSDISVGFQSKEEINLSKIDKSYSGEIYNKIKLDILNQRIKDGDFLTLAELATKYNVSKTPVRDALGALETQGYLKSLPRKGYLVKPVTQKNIIEYFQMRLILEVSAVNLVVKMASDLELKNILDLAMKFPEDNQNSEIIEFNELNNLFHMSIIQVSHNSLLYSISSDIMDNLSRVLFNDCKNIDFKNQKNEHIEIANALIKRDKEKSEKLITEHIIHLESRVYFNKDTIVT